MKRNIALMYGIALLQGMVFYGPVATLYRQAHGISIFQITLIEGISLLLCILLEFPWGIAADRIGYKRTLMICCWLYLLSKIIFWQADSFFWFLAERILLSVVIAGFSGVDASILYLSAEVGDSQKVFGVYAGMQMAGLLAASCIFTVFVRDNYSLAGLLTVISYGAAAVLSCGLVEVKGKAGKMENTEATGEASKAESAGKAGTRRNEKITRKEGAKGSEEKSAGKAEKGGTAAAVRATLRETIGAALGDGSILLFLIASALLAETHQTVTVFLNQLQYEKCGLRSGAIGGIYITATVIGMFGRFSPGITRRTGIRGGLWLFGGLAMSACLILAGSSHGASSVFGILLLRMSHTLFQPFQLELQNRQISGTDRASALSVHAMVMDGVAVATNLVFGILAERALELAFIFGVGICLISLFLFGIWYRRWRNAEKKRE